jgi:hypothetical protein
MVKLYQQGKILFCPPECSLAVLQQSHIVANQEELCERDDEFSLQSIFVHTLK